MKLGASSKVVLVTGGTGNMGREAVRRLLDRSDVIVRLFVRPAEKDHPLVRAWCRNSRIEFAWGDLAEFDTIERAVKGADVILHMGGLVSPLADSLPPELVTRVNVGGAKNIVEAIKRVSDVERVRLVYIGTVAQTGSRNAPIHWGRTGDPIKISHYDHYAVTKTQAEAAIAESGLRYWVSLRQTGMAHFDLWRHSGPIVFHNPINGVFEWSTANDSGRLMAAVAGDSVPEHFWRQFYNIGGGASSRVINHQFMVKSMAAMGVRDFRRILRPNWSATRNFHGQWYTDSDKLEALVPFREQSLDQFFELLPKAIPAPVRWIARLFPGAIHDRLKRLAEAPEGTLHWLAHDEEEPIRAFFGSRAEWEKIPSIWDEFHFAEPSREPSLLEHGYDESKAADQWTADDLRQAAEFRGGKCHATETNDPCRPVSWECALGHRFDMSPNLHLAGGHWCPTCQVDYRNYDRVAEVNPFFAQVWQEESGRGA